MTERAIVPCAKPRCRNAAGIISGLCAAHARDKRERDNRAAAYESALRLVVDPTQRGVLAETQAQLLEAIDRGNAFAAEGLYACQRLRENRIALQREVRALREHIAKIKTLATVTP